MNDAEILIIGAGASGLMAARELSRAGKKVIVLEARDRTGGRIHTFTYPGFSKPIEEGAEFIHGELPLIQSLLKEANISYPEIEGETYRVKNGKLEETENFIEGYPALISKLNDLREDITFAGFLDLYFKDDKYKTLRKSVIRFVEGYDAADINKVSSFALRDEWNTESDTQFRPKGGYSLLINYLAEEFKQSGGKIYISRIVKEIKWKKGKAEIFCENNEIYTSGKVLITIPVGVLKSGIENKGHILFSPEIPEMYDAISSIEYGNVVKIFLEFKKSFWQSEKNKNLINIMPNLSFLLSDLPPFTAWWTQLPDNVPLLTGWVGEPKAEELKNLKEGILKEKAIEAISYLFGTKISFVKDQLKMFYSANWGNDPFSCGAYTYSTPQSVQARKILSESVEDTLFFAGEAMYEGAEMGTIEAALSSGLNTAKRILNFI